MRVSIRILWLFALLTNTAGEARGQARIDDEGPVYLVYAGPYSSSPASVFGHLFIVIASSKDEPPPLWDAFTFAAESNGAGPLKFLAKGVFGGFQGRFQRVAFHEKTHDYEFLEDRDLWLVELVLTSEERQSLLTELESSTGEPRPYSFFHRNCAYYLKELLSRVSAEIMPPEQIESPIEVFQEVLASHLAGANFFRQSESERIRDASSRLEPEVVHRFRSSDWTELAVDTTWLANLEPQAKLFAGEYFAWRIRGEKKLPDENVKRALQTLRILIASSGVNPVGDTQKAGQRIPPPSFHGYSRLSASIADSPNLDRRITIQYRAALHDGFDPPDGHRPLNTLEVLSGTFSSSVYSFRPRLDELVFFSQRSLSPSDWITRRSSWMLEFVGRRGGVHGPRMMHYELRAGSGRTYRLGDKGLVYGLVTFAGVCASSMDGAFVSGIVGGLSFMPSALLRSGAEWTREYDLLDTHRWHERIRGWLVVNLSSSVGVKLIYSSEPLVRGLSWGAIWYP